MPKFVIGIDVGGTNIKLGVVNQQGTVIARSSLTTESFVHNKDKLIQALAVAVVGLISQAKLKKGSIAGIGIGLPGLIDPVKGIVQFLPNIPRWKNVPLKAILEKKLKIPTYLENDVNLITLGEWRFGAGRGVKNLACITLGTGVGGGLILNNQLYRGAGYVAGEAGHIPLNEKGPRCNCGGYACFERYVGNKTIIRKARETLGIEHITIPQIRKIARAGNKKALVFWHRIAEHIGNGLVGIINLLNPTMVVIGGGVFVHNHRFLAGTIRKVIRKRCMSVQAKMVKVVKAQLGNDAGIIGAQVLIHNA